MRGQQSLFGLLEVEEQRTSDTPRPRNFFMPDRDEAILHRFYYWGEIQEIRYDRVLARLEKEFYITKARLIVVLSNNNDHLNALIRSKPTVQELRKKIPHFNWRSPEQVGSPS